MFNLGLWKSFELRFTIVHMIIMTLITTHVATGKYVQNNLNLIFVFLCARLVSLYFVILRAVRSLFLLIAHSDDNTFFWLVLWFSLSITKAYFDNDHKFFYCCLFEFGYISFFHSLVLVHSNIFVDDVDDIGSDIWSCY